MCTCACVGCVGVELESRGDNASLHLPKSVLQASSVWDKRAALFGTSIIYPCILVWYLCNWSIATTRCMFECVCFFITSVYVYVTWWFVVLLCYQFCILLLYACIYILCIYVYGFLCTCIYFAYKYLRISYSNIMCPATVIRISSVFFLFTCFSHTFLIFIWLASPASSSILLSPSSLRYK